MTHRLSIHNLNAGYRCGNNERITTTVTDVSMSQGEIVCLLGPNGAGKSTLLRTIAGFQEPLSGEVLLDGDDIRCINKKELSRQISIVLTDNSNIHGLTVLEVVAMGRSPYTGFWGRLTSQDKDVVREYLQWLQIEYLADQKIDAISDGERQKVMIAKALAQQTPFILLDEPTSFLYYPDKVQIMQLLRRMAHEMGKCVLLSTHAVEIALQMADEVWFIEDGKFISGTPEELCNDKINVLSYEKIIDCIDTIRDRIRSQCANHIS